MNEENKNMELEILKIIDDDFNGAINAIRSFLQQDFESEQFSGPEKVAALLISLGVDISAKIFNELTDKEIEIIVLEIANMTIILSDFKEKIFYEFYNVYLAQQYITEGGFSFAKKILEKALGESKAFEIISKLTVSFKVRPFDFVRQFSSLEIYRLLIDENTDTIAIVLSQLKPSQASNFFNKLSIEKQLEVINYLATTEILDMHLIKEIEINIEKKSQSILMDNCLILNGMDTIVEILNNSDRKVEKEILDQLCNKNKTLHDDIVNKLFVFEDIICLTNNDIKKVINSAYITDEDLVLALKDASKDLKNVILNNLTGERKVIIEYRLEYSDPVYRKNVIKAQQKIIKIIRDLQNNDQILVCRGYEDEIIV